MSEVFSVLLHNRQRYEQGKEAYGFLCRPQPKNCKQPCGKSGSVPIIRRTFSCTTIEAHRHDLLSYPVIWCCPQAWMN